MDSNASVLLLTSAAATMFVQQGGTPILALCSQLPVAGHQFISLLQQLFLNARPPRLIVLIQLGDAVAQFTMTACSFVRRHLLLFCQQGLMLVFQCLLLL